jgi:hypothetical protein
MGKAPHWRLTEVGYHKQPPTQDFLRWDGTPFRDAVAPSPREPKARSGMAFCSTCGVVFKRTRKDAKYCSSACRSKANRKQIPVGESTDTYVGESTDRGVGESTDTTTDKRRSKHRHMQRISVGETTHISSIPSSRAERLPWSTPVLTEIPYSDYSPATEMPLEEYEASRPRLRVVATH